MYECTVNQEESVVKKRPQTNTDVNETSLNADGMPNADRKETDSSDTTWTWEDVVWINVLYNIYLNFGSVYGLYLIFSGQCKIATIFTSILFTHWGLIGVMAGAHRFWSHKSFKATWQLKLILATFYTIANEFDIWTWVLNHRIHHKYEDTNADPHNASRGLFYSHLGWLLLKEHPEVDEKRRKIDMSDCLSDPFVMIQKKYYRYLVFVISLALPTLILVYYFDETFNAAFHVGFIIRFNFILHATFLINSYAHAVGSKPYDKSIRPTENRMVSLFTQGEGWHNFHHTFPWDYHAAELGDYRLNITNAYIDFFAKIGWAYDLKTVSKEMIQRRIARSGDGSINSTVDDLNHEETKHEEPRELKC